MVGDRRLAGRTVLVTGAGGGIGSALCKTYARAGASVVVADVNRAAADEVLSQILHSGGSAAVHSGDLADRASVDDMVDFAVRRFGRIDVLHNNALLFEIGRVDDLTDEAWDRALRVGVTAYWLTTRRALPTMIRQGGGIVINTASVSGLLADYGMVSYNVVKAGILALTRTTGVQYARQGIRCNAICPGPVNTPGVLALSSVTPTRAAAMRRAIPMGRFADPDEIAAVALFLASDDAACINATHVVVDGGLTAALPTSRTLAAE